MVCTDVLEHVEIDCVRDVVQDITDLARGAVLLGICCKAGGKELADGRNAHILVKPGSWWREFLSQFGVWRELDGQRFEYNCVLRKRWP